MGDNLFHSLMDGGTVLMKTLGLAVILALGPLGGVMAQEAPQSQEGEHAPEQGFQLPRCSQGEAAPEAELLAALEKAGFKLESAHGDPNGGEQLTYAAHGDQNPGKWVRLLADGATACALAAGRDEETTA